jgi:hypothetical protein
VTAPGKVPRVGAYYLVPEGFIVEVWGRYGEEKDPTAYSVYVPHLNGEGFTVKASLTRGWREVTIPKEWVIA